jgi:hypothetical protein
VSRDTKSTIIRSYQIPIGAAKVTLKLAHVREVLGFAPPAPPTNAREQLDVVRRTPPTATLLVQEAINADRSDISFYFVKGSTEFELAVGHSCLGSVWNPEDGVLYHLIGVAKPTCLGEACGIM